MHLPRLGANLAVVLLALLAVAAAEDKKAAPAKAGQAVDLQGTWKLIAIDKEGKTLYSGSDDQTVKVWDLSSGKDTGTIKAHTKEVRSIALSKDGSKLATGSADGTVKIWDTKGSKELAMFKVEKDVTSKDPKTKYQSTAATKYKEELKKRAARDAKEYVSRIWQCATAPSLTTYP